MHNTGSRKSLDETFQKGLRACVGRKVHLIGARVTIALYQLVRRTAFGRGSDFALSLHSESQHRDNGLLS